MLDRLRALGGRALRPLLGSCVAVDTDSPLCALTFDDGPDPACTPDILEVLGRADARATFFALGDAVDAAPDLARRVVVEGHELGVHGMTHRPLLEMSPAGRARELRRSRAAVARASGVAPSLFRAPFGYQTEDTVLLARALRMRPVMWSAYARDWDADVPVADCVEHASPGIRPGGIVLLHDGAAGYDGPRARSASDVVDITERLLAIAASRALRVVTVSELLAAGRPRARMWFRHWRADPV